MDDAATARVAAFHTDTNPGDAVYHDDDDDCPYGNEIKSDHNDHPGAGHRRRCDWCAQHDPAHGHPAPAQASTA